MARFKPKSRPRARDRKAIDLRREQAAQDAPAVPLDFDGEDSFKGDDHGRHHTPDSFGTDALGAALDRMLRRTAAGS